MELKEYLKLIGISLLFFLGIPIRIEKSTSGDEERLFEEYRRKFNKTYNQNDITYLEKFENFKNSIRLIEELNKNRTSNQSALYGLTEFSDLSQDEFIKTRLQKFRNYMPEKHFKYTNHTRNSSHERIKRSKPLPLKVDWREKGVIGSIKNQKTCGACWAFSVIETAESMYALQVGSLVELSVQEVIDCARHGNFGCSGGDSCFLLDWLVATKTKITTQKLYPFIYKTGICTGKKFKTGVQIQSFSCDNFVDAEDLLREKIAFHGPVAAAVNAVNWQNYLGGIIQYHCSGEPQDLNHAVQIIGYDLTGPVPYYIARNSWGVEFGDKGYIYIAVDGNLCGLANEVTSLDVFK